MNLHNNFFSQDEIITIIDYKNKQPVSVEKFTKDGKLKAKHRNLNFNLDNILSKIIFPKVEKLFPNFKIDTGSFLESFYPYTPHTDTNIYHSDSNYTEKKEVRYNMSLLMPLTENFGSNTIFFDYYCDIYDPKKVLEELKTVPQNKKDFLYDHISKDDQDVVERLDIEYIYEWKIGDCIVWPRNQLHMASNYIDKNKAKEAIVFFID